jgi:hypothetical protein
MKRTIAVMTLVGSVIVVIAGIVTLILIWPAHGEQIGPRHGYNCPDFPDSRCPEAVMVSATGLWPPDDTPRANFAFLMLMFQNCRVYGYDAARDARGVQHWVSVQCDLQ